MQEPWSINEVAMIVADYFDMLVKELKRIPYNKSEHRRRILPLLKNRSQGSVEFKHQNISAILINHGMPYISGYLPRHNYQSILEHEVINYLKNHIEIQSEFHRFVESELINSQKSINFERIVVTPPQKSTFSEPIPIYQETSFQINYLERENRNKVLGYNGEALVIDFEKWSLKKNGYQSLADQIVWVSKNEGDGAGYDILSKNFNGSNKYIEVKTTRLGKDTPFYFSSNELRFSLRYPDDYQLYRLYNFDSEARLFQLNGPLDKICNSVPTMYKGFF